LFHTSCIQEGDNAIHLKKESRLHTRARVIDLDVAVLNCITVEVLHFNACLSKTIPPFNDTDTASKIYFQVPLGDITNLKGHLRFFWDSIALCVFSL
jgi:hypothetical protein